MREGLQLLPKEGGFSMLANMLEALIDIQALQNQDAEDRYISDGVSWHDYEALLAKRGDSPGCRVISCQAKISTAG
jgi:hypothetical protein